jgi:hypothetical protein
MIPMTTASRLCPYLDVIGVRTGGLLAVGP